LTAQGFTGEPTDRRTGTFELKSDAQGPFVRIVWNFGSLFWAEEWYLHTDPGNTLVRLDFKYNFRAQYGFGYGSNAGLDARRSLSTVRQTYAGTLRQDWVSWRSSGVTSGTQSPGVVLRDWAACTVSTWCITFLQRESQFCSCPGFPTVKSLQHYITRVGTFDRRDTWWHYCTCHPMGRNEFCYTGNSHIKPLLQILDDNGAFRGWVGVETSYNNQQRSPSEVLLGVMRFADL
jgi:hypothetical protein